MSALDESGFRELRISIEMGAREVIDLGTANIELPCPIHFLLDPSHNVEASAGYRAPEGHIDSYIIKLSEGFIVNLLLLGNYLLQHDDVLPDVGDTDRCSGGPTTFGKFRWGSDIGPQLRVVHPEDLDQNIVTDPRRHEALETILSSSVHFVVLHELWHILGGHLLRDHTIRRQNFMSECCSSRSIEAITDQAMEIDADRVASNGILRVANSMSQNRKLRIRLCGFVTALLFELFNDHDATLGEFEKRDHPHPVVRLSSVVRFADGEFPKEVTDIWQSGLVDGVAAITSHGTERMVVSGFMDAGVDEALTSNIVRWMDTLTTRLRDLQHDLRRL